jgi:tetratricopeptide (TPR) repeat protein
MQVQLRRYTVLWAGLGLASLVGAILLAMTFGLLGPRRNADETAGVALWAAPVPVAAGSPHSQATTGLTLPQAREAVRAQPESAARHKDLALLLAQQGQFEEAIVEMERAAALAQSGEMQQSLGRLLRTANRLPEARTAFAEAVRLRPDLAAAHLDLGDLLLLAGDARAAADHYEIAARQLPNVVAPRLKLGFARNALGQTSEAMACFEKVLLIDPTEGRARAMLETLRTQAGDHETSADSREASRPGSK